MKLAPVMAKFNIYFTPKKNLPYTRFKFFTYQTNKQNINEFVMELKSQSHHCKFGTLRDSLIRDRIVAGIQDAKVRERLLGETDLTLDKSITICCAAKATKKKAEEMQTSPPIDHVDTIKCNRRETCHPSSQRPRANGPRMLRGNEQLKVYKYCGYTHQKGKCPAYGKICNNCRKWNHFSTVSQLKAVNNIETNNKQDKERN